MRCRWWRTLRPAGRWSWRCQGRCCTPKTLQAYPLIDTELQLVADSGVCAGGWLLALPGGCCNPVGIPIGTELQVVADSAMGGEVELALPLPRVRLARCYLPWVKLAVTQVPTHAPCPSVDRGSSAAACPGFALLERACMILADCMSVTPWSRIPSALPSLSRPSATLHGSTDMKLRSRCLFCALPWQATCAASRRALCT